MRFVPVSVPSALFLLLGCVLAFGCGEGDRSDTAAGPGDGAAPWRSTDLWLLAPAEVRGHYATTEQRAIRALTPAPGSALRFSLELGAQPSLAFRPLVAPKHACSFRVGVRAVGGAGPEPTDAEPELRNVYSEVQLPTGQTLAAIASVDLADFAYQRVVIELMTAAALEHPCAPHWGSPAVVDRHGAEAVRGSGASSTTPNVLFLTADTLRADMLGAWGREPSGTPALDRLAETSDVFLNAFSSINNTNPSFASLMTGLYVKNHRVFDLTTQLPDAHTTLAEELSAAGYATSAVVSAAHLGRAGLQQGFDEFTQPRGQFFAETVVDMGLQWLQQGGDEPFLLWLHFFDPHTPHTPPEPYVRGLGPAALTGMGPVESWAAFRDGGVPKRRVTHENPSGGHPKLYASEIAYLDRQLDRLLDFVSSHGLDENTIVVFVADHGETLGERLSFYKHLGLYTETTHVPLMIRWPGQRSGRRLEGLVQHFDVFPTLLGAVGRTLPDQDGVDLRTLEPTGVVRDIVFANHANDRGEMARTGEHLYLRNRQLPHLPDGAHLYDVRDDPGAQRDLVGRGLSVESELRDRLGAWRTDQRRIAEPERREIDDEERRQLEALGYLD